MANIITRQKWTSGAAKPQAPDMSPRERHLLDGGVVRRLKKKNGKTYHKAPCPGLRPRCHRAGAAMPPSDINTLHRLMVAQTVFTRSEKQGG